MAGSKHKYEISKQSERLQTSTYPSLRCIKGIWSSRKYISTQTLLISVNSKGKQTMKKTVAPKHEQPGNLAVQIRDAICSQIPIAPLAQEETVQYCRGPEDIFDAFIDGLSAYPPSVMRLPMSVVFFEVSNYYDLLTRVSKRNVKRILNRLTPAIRHAVEDADIVVRFGRHRFAMLLVGADEEMAGRVCHRLKETVFRYSFLRLSLAEQLYLEFAVAQATCRDGLELAEVIFANERNIRLARNFGDGVIVKASEIKGKFRNHITTDFKLGESCSPNYTISD